MGETQTVWTGGVRGVKHTTYGPTRSMWWDCPLEEIRQDPSVGFLIRDEFNDFTTATNGLISSLTGGGTSVVLLANHGGVLELDPTGNDDDEAYAGSRYTWITPTAGREVWFECCARFTEANTDDANVMLGLVSGPVATGHLQAAGAGPLAAYYGACFFKVDGGTTWNCETSNNAAQTTNAGVATRTSGSYVRYGIKLSGLSLATFYIDDTPVSSIPSNLPAAATGVAFCVRNGGANNEKLYVDWYQVAGTR